MRIQTLCLFVPLVLSPIALMQKPAAKPSEKPAAAPTDKPADATVVPAQFLAPIDNIATQLAKGGREKEVKDLITALDKLGYPKANLDKLEKSTKELLAKAKLAIDSLPAGAKQLRTTAKQLVAIMDKIEDLEAKKTFAQNILLLDGNCAEAHKVLGHEKVGKTWVASELKDLRKRRGETQQKVQEAKKLEVEMETGEVDDPFVQRACGRKATLVRRGIVEIHSSFNLEKTTRILRESCRAVALGNWMRGKPFDLPPAELPKGRKPQIIIMMDSRDQYKKLQSQLASEKQLEPDEAKLLDDPKTELGAYTLITGEHIMLTQIESGAQADLLVYMSGLNENIWTALSAGCLDWLALSCFGCTLPNYVFKEEFRKREETHVETEDEKREREELLRVSKSGIAGSRTWMQYLAEHNQDPPWKNAFVLALGAVSGDDMHKATSMFEFLHEANLFQYVYKRLRPEENVNAVELYNRALEAASNDLQKKVRADKKKAAEEARKKAEEAGKAPAEEDEEKADVPENGSDSVYVRTVNELESKWRPWLLGSRPGVAERIEKENLNAWPKEALSVLEYMNDIRENTFKPPQDKSRPKLDGVWKLKFDPELSEQCALHAHYLTLHPEQQKWPDAHEEYADKEAYTVEGQWAGTHSVIVWGTLADHKEGIDVWMGSFYHRLPLIDPGVMRLGWGAEDIYQVMDMSSLAAPYDKPYIVLYPYDGQKEVPTKFLGNEYPDPIPDPSVEPGHVDESALYGYPITIQTNPVDERKVLIDIDMKLYEGKDGKIDVECFFSTPSKPTNPELAPQGAWCLIPKHHLKDNTEYKVVANWNTGGRGTETSIGRHVEWTFKTK